MTPEPIAVEPFVWAIGAIGVVVLLTAIIHTLRKRRAAPAPAAPAPAAAPQPTAVVRLCPCGARPTRPLPRAGMWHLPLVGRWWHRERDAYGEHEVCDPCGRHADAALDEHLAQTVSLAHARMEREIAREMASHERGLMQVVLDALPEEARREHARRMRGVRVREEGEG